jgi:class 3 adenylate cyclase/tetratricopeptide (TPR) repeat protein
MSLADYPTGFITIVFTDIVDSSRITTVLNQTERDRYENLLRDPHRERLRACLSEFGGKEVQSLGDGHFCVFPTPQNAVDCLVKFQSELRDNPLSVDLEGQRFTVEVRAGIHTSERTLEPKKYERDGHTLVDYSGGDINFAARISGLGGGGQILLSQSAYDRAHPEITQKRLHSWPERYVKSFDQAPQTVHELIYYEGQIPREPGKRFFSEWFQSDRNSYVARPDEEQAVIDSFTKPRNGVRSRLVTIHAEGGMGKTRLAVTCALRMAGAFEEIYFVPVDDVAANEYAVAEAIGKILGKSGSEALPDAICQSLHHSNILLLLDNYECCASDEAARFLRRLISETSGVHLLVTGRQTVGVRNLEQIVKLDAGMTRNQARQLFLERAALDGEHQGPLSDQDEEQLNRILSLISVEPDEKEFGPIPLAVELIAAWWSEKSLHEIADGLEATPLTKYTGAVPGMVPDANGHERHDSLTHSLEWSYNLLGKTTEIGSRLQTAFAICGLFPDALEPSVIESIEPDYATDELLIQLHRTSMLYKREVNGRTSYRLHRITREFALHKLEQLPHQKELKVRYIDYYAQLVESHRDIDSTTNRAVLDVEWRNLLAAAQYAIDIEDYISFFSIASDCVDFFVLRGLLTAWRTTAAIGLAAARKCGDGRLKASIVHMQMLIYASQGQWSATESEIQNILKMDRETGDLQSEGATLRTYGQLYSIQRRSDEAEEKYIESVEVLARSGDQLGAAITLVNLGRLYQIQHRWSEAEEMFERGLEISQCADDKKSLADTLNSFGQFYQEQGLWMEAETKYEESLTVSRRVNDLAREGDSLLSLAELYHVQSRWKESEAKFQESINVYKKLGARKSEGKALQLFGKMYLEKNSFIKADEMYQTSLDIFRENGDRAEEGWTLCLLAELRNAMDDVAAAITLARQAVKVLEGTQSVTELEHAREILSLLEAKQRGEQ